MFIREFSPRIDSQLPKGPRREQCSQRMLGRSPRWNHGHRSFRGKQNPAEIRNLRTISEWHSINKGVKEGMEFRVESLESLQ